MRTSEAKPRVFENVGECLYRYTPTGAYYARIKRPGKELRRSLDTTNRRWRSEGWPSYRFGASSPQEPHSPGTHDFHLVGQDAVPTDGTPMHVEKLKGLLWAQDIARAVRFHQTVFDAEAMRQS